jgi:hypothetical protein
LVVSEFMFVCTLQCETHQVESAKAEQQLLATRFKRAPAR